MKNIELFKIFCKNSLDANDVDPAIQYLKYIIHRMEMNEEQILWLCFLYAVTYQLPSAYLIWSEYPDLELLGVSKLRFWWDRYQKSIPFQTDKMKQRKNFVDTVKSYKKLVGTSQKTYFDNLLCSSNPQSNFDALWTPMNSIAYFGRFSIWNWCQALKHVAGYNIEPKKLMLGEPDSRSFTDGLAWAYDMPEKITKKVKINGKIVKKFYTWNEQEKLDLEKRCRVLKKSLEIDNFQLETLACAFKKIWRTNDSRYVGYYNDRIAEDIQNTSKNWKDINWDLLWDAREVCVPKEYIHHNLGVDKSKFYLTPEQKCRC